jgi:threonine/homoserine/homoserine lactone efflux protein
MPDVLLEPLAGIRWQSIGPLLLISLAIMGSPGPATLSLLAAGSVHGVRRSLPYLLGVIVGTALVLVAVASGVTAALLAVPALRAVLTVISAAYIVWLAVRIASAPPLTQPGAAAASAAAAFSLPGGLVLGVANPKGWVAIAAVFTSVELADAATTDAAAKVALLTAMIVVICATWLAAGASFTPLLRDPRRSRVVNVALAAALLLATTLAVLR